MKFIVPEAEELAYLRPDPLLWEQELDVRPEVAEAIERATGMRAGRVYWRSEHDHLYALELADLGARPPVDGARSTATGIATSRVRRSTRSMPTCWPSRCGWPRSARAWIRPTSQKVAQFAGIKTGWPEGSVLRTPDERFADSSRFPVRAEVRRGRRPAHGVRRGRARAIRSCCCTASRPGAISIAR